MSNLPIVSGVDGNLSQYLLEIRKFPMLTYEQEFMLAKRWREHDDLDAAHQLVTSHLRLVAKIAIGYRGYGLPMSDLVSEGNVGMMQAVKKFDPERGFRLSTYAMWWIRASIQEYILHSWSLVKIGTTAAQKKLFFNLRRLKGEMKAIDDGDLSAEQVNKIATELNVSEEEVINMNRRIAAPDYSLNSPMRGAYGEGGVDWQDMLVDESSSQAIRIGDTQESEHRHRLLNAAMAHLNPREREILVNRRLKDEPDTLDSLSQKYDISRERVRQIENRAFEKLQVAMKSAVAKIDLSEEKAAHAMASA